MEEGKKVDGLCLIVANHIHFILHYVIYFAYFIVMGIFQ